MTDKLKSLGRKKTNSTNLETSKTGSKKAGSKKKDSKKAGSKKTGSKKVGSKKAGSKKVSKITKINSKELSKKMKMQLKIKNNL